MSVTVVGLGPAGRPQLTIAALDALAAVPDGRRFARTARHPAVTDLAAEGLGFESFDAVYETAPDLPSAYAAIADRVLDATAEGDVVYAVPGSPRVAERSVSLVIEGAAFREVDVVVVDGVSFVEPVLAAVGADLLAHGLTVLDGRTVPAAGVPPSGRVPLIVAQVDDHLVLADAKLALLEVYPAAHEVALVIAAGTPDQTVLWSPLAAIDHDGRAPGHLASLWVPAVVDLPTRPFPVRPEHERAGHAFAELVALEARLRGPDGCPWDAEQTHASLAPYMLEETYETIDAIRAVEAGDGAAVGELEEELGDFLYQAVFHACLAEEQGWFDAADVVRAITDKLVVRHPHVFGDERVESAQALLGTWESRKRAEKGRESALDGVPGSAPALLRAGKLLGRAATAGAVLPDGALDADTVGAALLEWCARARAAGVEPETALLGALTRWEEAARAAEASGALAGTPALDLLP